MEQALSGPTNSQDRFKEPRGTWGPSVAPSRSWSSISQRFTTWSGTLIGPSRAILRCSPGNALLLGSVSWYKRWLLVFLVERYDNPDYPYCEHYGKN